MVRRFSTFHFGAAFGLATVVLSAVPVDALSPVLEPGLGSVEISVAGTGRRPVTVGVLVPERANARPSDAFELRGSSGVAIPVQTVPLVIDDAGRVRWLSARFAADLGAGAPKRFILRARSAPSNAPAGLRLIETDEAVAVDTGRLVARISRWEGPLVKFGSAEDAESFATLDAPSAEVDGTSYVADPNAFRGIAVEESGPLVVRVLMAGAISAPGGSPRLPYRCRLEFRRGWDGAFLTLEWPAPDRPLGPGVAARLAFRRSGGNGGAASWKTSETEEEETARPSSPPPRGTNAPVFVRRRRGPAEPRALEVCDGSLVVRLVAADRAFGGGRQATLEAYAGSAAAGPSTSLVPSTPAIGVAAWTSPDAGVPGFPGNPVARLNPAYESLLDRSVAALRAERKRIRLPDDFGDWERRPGVFGNLEFDTIDGLVRLAVRRRDPRLLSIARESYGHLRDVDLWRSPDAPFTEIRPRIHGRDHGGARFEAGHTFIEGVIALGLASGDPSILETGLRMASTAAARFVSDDSTYRFERGVGWLLHGLAAAAEAAPVESREAFRSAIRATLDGVERRRIAVPGLFAIAPAREDAAEEERADEAEAGRTSVVSTWVAASILAPGLRRASEASGDPRGAAWAEGLASFLAASIRRDDARRRFALFGRLEVDVGTGDVSARSGTVWAENFPLVASGLDSAAPRGRDVRAFSALVFSEGAAALSGATRLGGEARSKIWRGLLRSARD